MELNAESLSTFSDRLRAIQEDTQRQWGKMDVARMMRHLRFTFDMSLGVEDVPDKSIPVIRNILWILSFRVFTNWPKGKLKGPDFVTPPAEHDFEKERNLVLEKMQQFVDAAAQDPERIALNPFMGQLPLRKWQRLHGLHTHHHLKQFGV